MTTAVDGADGAGVLDVDVVDSHVVFPTGSRVECETALHTLVAGEVLCYDENTRLLVIRDTAGGKPLMRFVNLALVTNVTTLASRGVDFTPHTPCSSANHRNAAIAQERLARALEKKRNAMLVVDVPRVAQAAFLAIRKTLEKIRWQGDSIVVLERVLLAPPYTPDCIRPLHDGTANDFPVKEARDQLHKILTKHLQLSAASRESPSEGARASRDASNDSITQAPDVAPPPPH